MERMEAFFSGHGFDPHRHDTYAIGYTMQGVQAFRYRGAARASAAGQAFVLHPDELHDGHAGTGAGFRYRILYVAPALVHAALGERGALPFWRDVIATNGALMRAIVAALDDLESPLDELARDQIVLALADALAVADRSLARRTTAARHVRASARARDLLDASVTTSVTSAELEAVTGLTRFAAACHFRACYGTSPHRYLTMRRLDRARALIRDDATLAEVAVASGFADQSHLTRQFRKAYGLAPGRYARMVA